jgi:prefoldin subunit 5
VELKEFSSFSEAIKFAEDKLNELEREAELVAGMLENLEEVSSSFEELSKELGGEVHEAFYKASLDNIALYIEPSPMIVEQIIKKKAEELTNLIEMYKKISEVLKKASQALGDEDVKITLAIDSDEAKVFMRLKR